MKILQKYKAIAMISASMLFVACAQEDQPKESQLDYTVQNKTELDNWIGTSFLDPYNIKVYYEWNQNLVDNNRFLFPPTVDKVQPALEVVKKIWIDSYSTIGGADFVKKISPREFVLVGGTNLNTSGTMTLGLAEGGQRVTLFQLDYLNRKSRADVTEFIHTIQHEYVHILNQTKPFDEQAWAKLTPSGYTSSWYVQPTATSRSLGFITSYARLNIYEDFAETASIILTSSKAEYDAILASVTDVNAKANLKKKEAIVVQYYKDNFNMDFYALRDEAQKNTTAVINN
ncbi:substrate import-associated zinc metallohydrolase lipoprotein [Flavobacterium sp. HSC-32F16]|uniref:zinc-binding metallopeptidase n=1 Tax=Flavobacterium sp. HSC-32F16 TaxID=2910964 RepID=UPI0020A3BB69|nr:putative zinc-binding metallopeptidase [Flavobacterium sp. HSC-32F16]MCP2025034.1 substrate import-associated zinc metallohydrolase lipoprotein [Flavobacterium sp. HSC-32F16]